MRRGEKDGEKEEGEWRRSVGESETSGEAASGESLEKVGTMDENGGSRDQRLSRSKGEVTWRESAGDTGGAPDDNRRQEGDSADKSR